jgi:hypothetical protein
MWKKGIIFGIILLFVGTSVVQSISGDFLKESDGVRTRGTLYVGGSGPGNYSRIQDAIDNASDGDTIFVFKGVYYENVFVDKSIDLVGENKDSTIIDGSQIDNVVYAFHIANFKIEGFTVRNSNQGGSTPGNVGVHINYDNSHSGTYSICNCTIEDNGDGIALWNTKYCTITIKNCVIINNIYNGINGGLGIMNIISNTISNNDRSGYTDWAGADNKIFINNIITSNAWYGINPHKDTPRYISYNNVWNNSLGNYYEGDGGPFTPIPGTGEISDNPLFVDSANGDYHLQSTQGSYHGGAWTPDSNTSPCIDAGDPAYPYENELEPNGGRINMGADGNTNEASKSPVPNQPPDAPTITGPNKGKIGVATMYNFSTIDPNGDDVHYFIDWGDSTNSSWIGPYSSGATVTKSHTWTTKGTYIIKAKAKDTYGNESNWSTLSVTMPLSYEPPRHPFLLWLVERFPHAFPILRHLLGY